MKFEIHHVCAFLCTCEYIFSTKTSNCKKLYYTKTNKRKNMKNETSASNDQFFYIYKNDHRLCVIDLNGLDMC